MQHVNTFRFESFKEAIKKKVVVSFKCAHYPEDYEELDSYFAISLERWNHINHSDAFVAFRKRIAPYCLSLKLLMLHQREIMSQLKECLSQATPSNCAPFLDLTASLSCDLREDFSHHLEDFITIISDLLISNDENLEVLQESFSCLAHLVYFLHKTISSNIDHFLKLFTRLLSYKTYVSRFTSGCLAFVLRKYSEPSALLRRLVSLFDGNSQIIGNLLFELIHGIHNQFHSIAHEVLPVLFGLISESEPLASDSSENLSDVLLTSWLYLLPTLLENFQADSVCYLLKLLQAEFKKPTTSEAGAKRLISVLSEVITLLHGPFDKMEDILGQIFSNVITICQSEETIRLLTDFLQRSSRHFNPFHLIRSLLLDEKFSVDLRYQFVLNLVKWTYFDRDIAPILPSFMLHLFERGQTASHRVFLTRVCLLRSPLPREPLFDLDEFQSIGSIDLATASGDLTRTDLVNAYVAWLLEPLQSAVRSNRADDDGPCPDWLVLCCLPHISPLPVSLLSDLLQQLTADACRRIEASFSQSPTEMVQRTLLIYLLASVETRVLLSARFCQTVGDDNRGRDNRFSVRLDELPAEYLLTLARLCYVDDLETAVVALRLLDLVLSSCPGWQSQLVCPSVWAETLLLVLKSPSHQVRLHALRCLKALSENTDGADRSSAMTETTIGYSVSPVMLPALQLCLQAERHRLEPQTVRNFHSTILQLHAARVAVQGVAMAAHLVMNHLLGLLHLKMSSTWTALQEAVASFCEVGRAVKPSSSVSSKADPDQHHSSSSLMPVAHEDWHHVASRCYWSAMEPWLQDTHERALHQQQERANMPAAEVAMTTANLIDLLTWQVVIEPDLHQLAYYRGRTGDTLVTSRTEVSPLLPDWSAYQRSLWRCLRPVSAGKKARVITPLAIQLINHLLQHGISKPWEEMLLITLDLFSKLTNITSIPREPEFRACIYNLLSHRRPAVQKAALLCLSAYRNSGLTNYRENLERIIDPKTFRDEIRTFKLNESISNSDHLAHISPIFLRILFGRLQQAKGQFAAAIFTNLASCSQTELAQFIDLILSPLCTAIGDRPSDLGAPSSLLLLPSIRLLEARIRRELGFTDTLALSSNSETGGRREAVTISWSKLHALCKLLNFALDYMRNRLGASLEPPVAMVTDSVCLVVERLLRLGLYLMTLVLTVSRAKASKSDIPLPPAAQVKVVHCTGTRLLVHLFTDGVTPTEFWLRGDRLDAVREVCLSAEQLHQLTHSTSVSTNNHPLLRLAPLWSRSRDLTRQLLAGPPVKAIANLLASRLSGSGPVAERLMEILSNLVFLPELADTGPKLVELHHAQLIVYLERRLKELSRCRLHQLLARGGCRPQRLGKQQQTLVNSPTLLQYDFRMVGYIASSAPGGTGLSALSEHWDHLLRGLFAILSQMSRSDRRRAEPRAKSSARRRQRAVGLDPDLFETQLTTVEQVEAELMRALVKLVAVAPSLVGEHFSRLLHLFARLNSRVGRGILCQAAGVCFSRLDPSVSANQLTSLGSPVVRHAAPLSRLTAFVDEFSRRELQPWGSEGTRPPVHWCESILSRLNAWDTGQLDQVDGVIRERTFALMGELARLLEHHEALEPSGLHQHLVFLHLGSLNCAIHTLAHADLQLRDAALEYTLAVCKSVSISAESTTTAYRTLVSGCLWPGILQALRQSSRPTGPRRLHVLQLLTGLVMAFRSRAEFAPLALLMPSGGGGRDKSEGEELAEKDSCFFTNLQSASLARQASAIRRLALFLRNPLTVCSRRQVAGVAARLGSLTSENQFILPERHLSGLFVPLLHFYLLPLLAESNDGVSDTGRGSTGDGSLEVRRRLADHCLDALGALAGRLSWSGYRKLLEATIRRLEAATTGNSQLASRMVIVLVDAFHFHPVGATASQEQEPMEVDGEAAPLDVGKATAVKGVEKTKKSFGNADGDVTAYMLSVIKRLQPLIAKPRKADQLSSKARRSKPSKILLVISLVSLLRRLPAGHLHSELPGLVLRVVELLRPSRDSCPKVRAQAVRSLTHIARMIGPGPAVDTILRIVNQQLSRGGYAAHQVRLFTVNRILAELDQAIASGDVKFSPGNFDSSGRLLIHLYLEELVGGLAEEMDSRRAAGQLLTSIRPIPSSGEHATGRSSNLAGTTGVDLPEGNGLKAPEGLARLCRLLSIGGLVTLFSDLVAAIKSGSCGMSLNLESGGTAVGDTVGANVGEVTGKLGCGLRFRARALARLEVALSRLPTRNGVFSPRQQANLSPTDLLQLACRLISDHLGEVLAADRKAAADGQSRTADGLLAADQRDPSMGWRRPRSKPLEKKWSYLEVDKEPGLEGNLRLTQSSVTQEHLLVTCGLQLMHGLLRFRWLSADRVEDVRLLESYLPLLLDCMQSKYVRVLAAALRCLHLVFTVTGTSTAAAGMLMGCEQHAKLAAERLFLLLASHPGLLSTRTAARDTHAQQFATNLYRALAALVQHQVNYPLTRQQLATLLNAVDIELTRDAATTPSLALFRAILQRRLRDPKVATREAGFLSLSGDPELSADMPSAGADAGLVTASCEDADYQTESGSGGGSRLLSLFRRLQVLAITSASERVRSEARLCLVAFLLNYPHKARFLHTFLAFCLRQLEYPKSTGRLSAITLLTGLVSDLPIDRLQTACLDEAILLSVGAAIEREPVISLRVALLSLLRILFSRLPEESAQTHFRDYLLGFLTASSVTRMSARLLGLQAIPAVLDCQPCLSIERCRPALLHILGQDTLARTATQLHQLVIASPAICTRAGLDPLYRQVGTDLSMAEEVAVAKAALEDAQWMAGLKVDDELKGGNTLSEQSSDEASPLNECPSDDVQQKFKDDDDDLGGGNECEVDTDDSDSNELDGNKATEDVQLLCQPLVVQLHLDNRKLCKSAVDKHYFLVAYTLEHGLRLFHRLLNNTTTTAYPPPATGEVAVPQLASLSDPSQLPLSPHTVDSWAVLTGTCLSDRVSQPVAEAFTPLDPRGGIRMKSRMQKAEHKSRRQEELYRSLMPSAPLTTAQSTSSLQKSLLCCGHRGAREWASRCLLLLLRAEASLVATVNDDDQDDAAEGVGLRQRPRSAFFRSLARGKLERRRKLAQLLENLMQDCIFQLQYDTRQAMNADWSDSLIANLICLGQLLHVVSGRKPVLRLFRAVNRVALDELNNRPHSFMQRTLAVKLAVGLLLRLPRPSSLTRLLSEMEVERQADDIDQMEAVVVRRRRPAAYIAYLTAASRHLAREFRQKDRLAFLAASSLSFTGGDDTQKPDAEADANAARLRLGSRLTGRLSRELSIRAKARRKKAEARLRRTLLSGSLRPCDAHQMASATVASRLQAGVDQLIEALEAAEVSLADSLNAGATAAASVESGEPFTMVTIGRQLLQLVCSRASRIAKARRAGGRAEKARRAALGLAWQPSPQQKQPEDKLRRQKRKTETAEAAGTVRKIRKSGP